MTTLTLTHPTAGAGGTPMTVTLPAQLTWPDEFTWQQVDQSAEYTTTGALVLDAYARQAGRPITLVGTAERVWCERGLLLTLRAWASVPGLVLTLAGLRGSAPRQVVFDHAGGALSAEVATWELDTVADTDPYAVALKFLEL